MAYQATTRLVERLNQTGQHTEAYQLERARREFVSSDALDGPGYDAAVDRLNAARKRAIDLLNR